MGLVAMVMMMVRPVTVIMSGADPGAEVGEDAPDCLARGFDAGGSLVEKPCQLGGFRFPNAVVRQVLEMIGEVIGEMGQIHPEAVVVG